MDKVSAAQWVRVLWLCASVAGCGGGGGGSAAPPPSAPPPPAASTFRLTNATPADNAVGTATTSFIDLQFSADLLLPSVTSYTVRLHTRDGDVPAQLQLGTRTVRVAPTRRLAPNEAHTVSLITPLADTQGNMLQATQVHFTTAGPAWQAPQFARAGDCTTSGAGAALLDDGTLLMSCFGTSADTSIQRRDPAGQWQAPLAAPTTTLARPTVRQLAGDQALVSWYDSNRSNSLGRVYRTASGWGALLAPPVPTGQVSTVDDFGSYSTDQQLVRSRPWLASEAGTAVVGERVYELIDATTGAATHAFHSEAGRVGQPGTGCVFPNGDRLYVFSTRNTNPSGNNIDWRFHAAIHTASGWSAPVRLDSFIELGFTSQPVCAANGVARVYWANQSGTLSRYADWTSSQGWAAVQNLSSTQQLLSASFPAARRGSDGSALTFWSDFRTDPNGSTSDGSTRYASVPRLFEVTPGGTAWRPLLGLPRYEGGTTHDARVIDVAHDPATGRYAVIAQGGLTGNTERFFTEYGSAGGWSTPWTPLTAQGQAFAPASLYFNASGQGVALGLVQGQTYLSEWR